MPAIKSPNRYGHIVIPDKNSDHVVCIDFEKAKEKAIKGKCYREYEMLCKLERGENIYY